MGIILNYVIYILLSGDPPFNGPSDSDIYTKIADGRFTFPEKKWKNISNDAKDLICHMLAPENERYTASQVLEHKWFQNAPNVPLSDIQFNELIYLKTLFTEMKLKKWD